MNAKTTTHLTRAVRAAVITVLLAGTLFPLVWLGLTSFKTGDDLLAIPPRLVFTPSLTNYRALMSRYQFGTHLVNSLLIASGACALSLVTGALAAYGFARFQFPGRRMLELAVLGFRILPPIALVIPLFLLFRRWDLIDRRLGLILAHAAFEAPLVIWLLIGFFRQIPIELEEAAWMDGCSRPGAWWRVVLPLAAPGVAAAAILCFLASWNEYLFAMMLTGRHAKTLPVAITGFITDKAILWGEVAAAGTLILAPVVLLTGLVQRVLLQGFIPPEAGK